RTFVAPPARRSPPLRSSPHACGHALPPGRASAARPPASAARPTIHPRAGGDRRAPLPGHERWSGDPASPRGAPVSAPLGLLTGPIPMPENGPNPVALLLLVAGMTVLPFLLVMLTSFTKMSVVLSLTRSALGTQQAPPT